MTKQEQKKKILAQIEKLNNSPFMCFKKWEVRRMILRKSLLKLL